MENCEYLDVKRMHLCQGMNAKKLSQGYRNAFSFDTDLTDVSIIRYGTRRLVKPFEV